MIVALSIYVLLAQAMTPEAIEHTQAGMEAQKQGHFDQAIEEFKKVIAASPEMPSAYANLGIAYFKMGNYEQAIPALEQSLKLNPKLLGVHQALGVALLIRGDAAGALPHLETAREPTLLGMAYLETGRLNDAIAALQVALQAKPNDPDVLYYFGRATALASKKAYDRIAETNPGSARAHQAAGDEYFELGKLPEAAKEYLASIQIKPYSEGVHLALGHVLTAAGKWPEAVVEFRAELKLRPASAQATYDLGSALLEQGQARDALTVLAHADELEPNMPPTLLALGKAALATNDPARAEKLWTKLLQIQQDGEVAAQAHFELAALDRKAGKASEADREMKEYQRLKAGATK
jgi:tetratricopeptide (TPR) repeat protein